MSGSKPRSFSILAILLAAATSLITVVVGDAAIGRPVVYCYATGLRISEMTGLYYYDYSINHIVYQAYVDAFWLCTDGDTSKCEVCVKKQLNVDLGLVGQWLSVDTQYDTSGPAECNSTDNTQRFYYQNSNKVELNKTYLFTFKIAALPDDGSCDQAVYRLTASDEFTTPENPP
jgi:hypothetical protein